MATEQSLFGATPESIQQARDAALNTQAASYAQMDPFQRASFNIYRGANQLGGAVGGMLGGTDPQMLQMQQRQALLQGVDINDPQALLVAAQKASQMKDYGAAQELSAKAQALRASGIKGRLDESTIAKNLAEGTTTEMKNASGYADTMATRGTPEWNAAYKAKLTEVTTPVGKGDTIKEVGVAFGSNKPVYTFQTSSGVQQVTFETDPKSGKQIMMPYVGPVDRKTAKTEVSMVNKGETKFIEKLGELDAKAVSDAMISSKSARSTLSALEKLNNLNDESLISGSFSVGRIGATNLLNTLGLTSQADAARLATSENYQKVAGDVVLQTLGGKLGAGFSNEDRKFIEGLVPQLENSAQARRQLINFMASKNRSIISEASKLEQYARKNNGLGGYESPIPFGDAPTGASALSTEQLLARRKQIQEGRP